MNKNLIPTIAENLGVKVGEVFYIRNSLDKYMFTDKDLIYYNDGIKEWKHSKMLNMFVNGSVVVEGTCKLFIYD